MSKSVANQRFVKVHRENLNSNFLGVNNDNWRAAARDLGATAFLLYVYLVANADNYEFALSPSAITNSIGMPESTYRDQFRKLVSKGYLVDCGKNKYEFYEAPKGQNPADLPSVVAVDDNRAENAKAFSF